MKVEFSEKFYKDLDKIKIKQVKLGVIAVIENVEKANKISDIKNIKKLKGYAFAYRIRFGDYRIGIFIENNIIEFSRIVHRKDIYNIFP